MNNKHISHITAVTEVFPKGQKCVRALVEFDTVLDKDSISIHTFTVAGRTITDVKTEKNIVMIELDASEPSANIIIPGDPWENIPAKLQQAKLLVTQVETIKNENGMLIFAELEPDESDDVQNILVDEFIQGEYKGLKYNLFIPEDYDSRKKYPMIQFIHDAGICGENPLLTLAQGHGALVWMTREEQKKHPCFVFAPQFDLPAIVDDDWNVDERLETAKETLDYICNSYNIDRDRIYTTGQSMGCMSSIVLNVRYPDYFAASYLVAGQWNERQIDGLERQRLWMINSQGDAKAFPIMNQMNCEMEKKGAKIVHKVWSAGLSQDEYKKEAQKLILTGANIIYTPYELTTVADGWHSNGGEHHVNTWATAYDIEAIRDWLFSNHR